MTVSNTQVRVSYTGDGSSTHFTIPFPFYLSTDITVMLGNSVQSSGYTITGGQDANGDPQTGTVIFTSAPASTVAVQFILDVPLTQLVSLVDGTAFPSDTLNQVNDRAIQAALRLNDLLGRTISAPDGDVSPNLTLPISSTRANTYLTFDSNGNLAVAQSIPSGTLSQASIGSFLYPRTNAETAAGVTPTNYAYTTIDVTRFGAVGDGATDNTTALQNILNVAKFGRIRVHFTSQSRNGQTVYLTGPLNVYEGTYVTADTGVVVQSTNTNANLQIFQCLATLGAATNLSANAKLGDTAVTVASNAGLVAGQVVKISDSGFLVGSVPNFEHNEILSVSGTTIVLKQALIGAYTTANTAQLTPHSAPARDIHFENVKVVIPTTGGADGGSFYFQDAYSCSVRNCESQGAKGQPSIQMWRSAYCRVFGGVLRDGQNLSTPGQGYGINIAQGSHHCVAFNVQMRNIRENAVSLGARFSGFVACMSYSPYDNGFNAHASGSFDCFAIGCGVIGSSSSSTKGYYAGASDTRMSFLDCFAVHLAGRAIWLDNGSVDCEVKNFRSYNTNMQGGAASDNCVLLLSATRPRLSNVTVDANSQAAVRAAIRIETCTDAILKGGSLRNVPSGWGVQHANCTGVQIDYMTIGNVSQGIAFDTTPSSGTLIRHNKVDNDSAFSLSTGDVCEFNEYNTKRQNSRGKSSGSVADGGTITHGCVTTPYAVRVTPLGGTSTDIVKVSSVGATTFTVSIKTTAGAAGSSVPIMWSADA